MAHIVTYDNFMYTAPTPRIFLKPNYLQKGIIGEAHDLVCMIVLSFTAQAHSVNVTWIFTSNDDRVTVIPTTITTDDSIGIIYTTVIQFAYLMEGDEGNYTCAVTIDEGSGESIYNLETICKHKLAQVKYILASIYIGKKPFIFLFCTGHYSR